MRLTRAMRAITGALAAGLSEGGERGSYGRTTGLDDRPAPRASCAARTMHCSLGGWPQRSHRSQSPQANSWRRARAISRASPMKTISTMLIARTRLST